jgi:chromosome segregation ATPase
MFVNSLAVNHSSEERIRECLSVELGTKDKTITDLQERIKELSGQLEMRESHVIALVTEKKVLADSEKALTERIAEYKDDIKEKNSLLADYKIQKNLLATMVDEYKPYKEECEARRVKYEELLQQMKNIQNENTALLSQVENISRMKDFYQAQVEAMQAEAKEVAKRVVDLDREYKDTVNSMSKQHKLDLEKQKQELTEKFNDEVKEKVEFETAKLQMEVARLKLELERAGDREKAASQSTKNNKSTKK